MIDILQVVVCSCLEELHQRIDTSQLQSELGGYLPYHHQEWIDTRVVSAIYYMSTCIYLSYWCVSVAVVEMPI